MASSSFLLCREAVHRLKVPIPCSYNHLNHCLPSFSLRGLSLQPCSIVYVVRKQHTSANVLHKTVVQRLSLASARFDQTQSLCCSLVHKVKSKLDVDIAKCRSRRFLDPRSSAYHLYFKKKPKLLPLQGVRSFSTAIKYATLSDVKDKDSQHVKELNEIDSSEAATDERKSILDKDPELKSIIEDIKRDFAKEQSKDDKEKKKPEEEEKQVKFNEVEDIEFDYSVAEDIEEYDYIDESEIGQHEVRPPKSIPISLERGESGVFDLDELLLLLDQLGAENIVSFPVPPQAKFCDHMIVVSAKSRRHLQAINEEMMYIHKRKKSPNDSHLVIEGLDKSNWCAMDLGNIVLHVFYGNLREYYDIESLWTLGPDNDPKCQEVGKDPYALSAEDLFWLEAAKSKTGTTATTTATSTEPNHLKQQGGASPPPRVSDSDAGWGNTPS